MSVKEIKNGDQKRLLNKITIFHNIYT